MNKQGKVWGTTRELFKNPFCEAHFINVAPNSYCSQHKHNNKYNAFYVISGELVIKVWKNDYDLCDETLLQKGDFTIVNPNEYHQFLTTSLGAEVMEIYYPQGINGQDIVRQSVGGTAVAPRMITQKIMLEETPDDG